VGIIKMRYWKRIRDNYVIKVDCQMSLLNWIEITKELFDELVLLRGK
jgi:hypothetical protein